LGLAFGLEELLKNIGWCMSLGITELISYKPVIIIDTPKNGCHPALKRIANNRNRQFNPIFTR